MKFHFVFALIYVRNNSYGLMGVGRKPEGFSDKCRWYLKVGNIITDIVQQERATMPALLFDDIHTY